MDPSDTSQDVRYPGLSYGMGIMGSDAVIEIYGRSTESQLQTQTETGNNSPHVDNLNSPGSLTSGSVNIIPQSNNPGNSVITMQRGLKRTSSEVCFDESTSESHQIIQQAQLNLSENCTPSATDESFANLGPPKKSPPSNGKKTKGRVKIKMEYIDNKLRRYTTFSKRKTGIMKKVKFFVHKHYIYGLVHINLNNPNFLLYFPPTNL